MLNIKALDLSEKYFNETAYPELKKRFPDLVTRFAAGLVGNGSECFGYDDEISTDHDWGVDFFIWLSEQDRCMISEVREFKETLLVEFPHEYRRNRSVYGAVVDVMTCSDFYRQLIGFQEGPCNIKEWRIIPEENLAMAVNGRVFYDKPGTFSEIREKLLGYYPEDLRRKKMAARCMAIAQTGQYNYLRMAKREDWVTVQAVLARFYSNAISLVFLLNKVFCPFYKWAYRRMKELPLLGNMVGELIYKMALVTDFSHEAIMKRYDIITDICKLIADELREQRLTSSDDWFFVSHGEELQRSIEDDFLFSLPPQYE